MANDDNGDPAVLEVLLVSKILVSCQEDIVPCLLSGGEQFSVSQTIPLQIKQNRNTVADEIAADGKRYALIKQNEHV